MIGSLKVSQASQPKTPAEAAVAAEFPALYTWFSQFPARRPDSVETWERTLQIARNCAPIIAELRSRGFDLVLLEQSTPPGRDLVPLYQTIINWLPKVQDPLSLTICLGRLMEPGARPVIRKHRELLLRLARQWNRTLRKDDREHTLSALAQWVGKVVRQGDVPEVIEWIKEHGLASGARAYYIWALQRFAKESGPARDALVHFLSDEELGGFAVLALVGAMKRDALPFLRDLQASSPHETVRNTAEAEVRKMEARTAKVTLPKADPAMLPLGYGSTSFEQDTGRLPGLLSSLEQALEGSLQAGVAEQLARSAVQVRRGLHRFHIVQIVLGDGASTQLGFGLYGKDEDVLIVELYFDEQFRETVRLACDPPEIP
jgi:hypothetical protein